MNEKKTRYGLMVFTLDQINRSVGAFAWNEKDIDYIVKDQEEHFGLKPLAIKEEAHIVMEYSNIIWDFKIYYSSFKKRYTPLLDIDERWVTIEKILLEGLKTIGLEELKDEVVKSLKAKKYFEYKNKSDEQFKKYCITEN